MKRRRTAFATPFVVTAACGGAPDRPATPPPPVDEANEAPSAPVVKTVPEGALFVLRGGTTCYAVSEGARDQIVTCPPAGPNVKLPEKTRVRIGTTDYRLDLDSLHCYREVLGNPPSWRRDDCPPQLLPELIGLTPDEHCMYQGVTFRAPSCTPKVSGTGAVNARIINAEAVQGGVDVVIGAGTDRGLGPGVVVRLAGVGTATIVKCTTRSCMATFVGATLDQILSSSTSVTFE